MKRAFKWILLGGGGLVVLIILALLIVPLFVSIDDYRPMIEERVSEATGRPFKLAGDLDLSLFPWTGFALSDLHLGNPPEFEAEDFLYVKSFDVRVKLLPLISRDVQVKRFILEGIQLNLEKARDGRTNWEDLGGPGPGEDKEPHRKESPEPSVPAGDFSLPLKALAVGDFSVSGGVLWMDHAAGLKKEISNLSLKLKNVSLERPIGITLSAYLDGMPMKLEGTVGPVGKDPMTASIPLDFSLAALGRLNLTMKGLMEAPATKRRFDVALRMEPFSPRALFTALGGEFPLSTADPDVFNQVSLDVRVEGTPDSFSLKDGSMKLDESNLNFSALVRDLSRPDLAFAFELDRMNLDRYLPPQTRKDSVKEKAPPKPAEKTGTVDYDPLRRLMLDGSVTVGALQAQGMTIEDIAFKVNAKDGMIRIDPLSASLYQGTIQSDALVDVKGSSPKSRMAFRIDSVQAGPLVRDLAHQDIIEGNVQGDVRISTVGDQPETIKKNLNGEGELLFRDGAVVGIDIPGMVRNVKSAFTTATTAKPSGERPKTDFSELSAPFTIRNGVVNTSGTELKSPLIRVVTTGNADLVNEVLDLRVDPKLVATLKGQDDTEERRGIRVPILVSGSFAEPKFRPDLKGMIDGGLKEVIKEGVSDPSELKKLIKPGTDESGEDEPKSTEDKVKGVLKGLGIGQ